MDIKGPTMVSLDITNKCNYRCLHCYNNSGENPICENELSDIEIINLIDQIIEMQPQNFCFCGGEPLLRKNLVLECLEKLSTNNIKCAIVTNGFYVTDQIIKDFKRLGITNVQISLDGVEKSHNKLRGHPLAFDRAIQALEILQKNDVSSSIAFSPTAWNIEDLDFVYQIANKYNSRELRVQELMPIGRALDNKLELPNDTQYRLLRRRIYELNFRYYNKESKVTVEWGDPIDHFISWSNMNDSKNNFTEALSIKADGSITPSIYLPFSFGNVRKHTLNEYWNAGLCRIWEDPFLLRLTKKFSSIKYMQEDINSIQKTLIKEKKDDYDIIDNQKKRM